MTAHPERCGHSGERRRSGVAVHGLLADPDNQSPVVLTADARSGRARLDSDGETHFPSVRPSRLR